MNRRRLLRAVAAGGIAGSAGCLGALSGDPDPNVVLGKPDLDVTIEQHRGRRYPVWGERVPDVRLPAALADRAVSVRDLDRPALVTFYFSHCRTVCPRLVSALANVQGHAVANGYADAVGFLPVTFDPARDTPERLRAYADRLNVADAGWWWLRPQSETRAREVVEDDFGVSYRRREREGEDGYLFVHPGVVLLVNAGGYVERAYRVGPDTPPPVETAIADLRRVRTA